MADPKTQRAFDVSQADPKLLDRYGRNSFGYSLLLARQLVEAGVNLVQVNLGNNEIVGHARQRFPAFEELPLPAHRSRRVARCSTISMSVDCWLQR